MDSVIVTLLALGGLAIAGVTKLFIWLSKRDFEKLKAKRYKSDHKCGDPCTPCQCGDTKECEEFDVCCGRK